MTREPHHIESSSLVQETGECERHCTGCTQGEEGVQKRSLLLLIVISEAAIERGPVDPEQRRALRMGHRGLVLLERKI